MYVVPWLQSFTAQEGTRVPRKSGRSSIPTYPNISQLYLPFFTGSSHQVLCWAFNLPALIASVYSLVQVWGQLEPDETFESHLRHESRMVTAPGGRLYREESEGPAAWERNLQLRVRQLSRDVNAKIVMGRTM